MRYFPSVNAVIRHRVRAGGKTGSGKIGSKPFIGGHPPEWRRAMRTGVTGTSAAEQRANRTASLFHLPKRIAAVADGTERIRCA